MCNRIWQVLIISVFGVSISTQIGGREADSSRALIRGGAAVVFFRVRPEWTNCRVVVGEASFSCFPLPASWPAAIGKTSWCNAHTDYDEEPSIELFRDSPGDWRFALIAYPWNASPLTTVRLRANGAHRTAVDVPVAISLQFRSGRINRTPVVLTRHMGKIFRSFQLSVSERDLAKSYARITDLQSKDMANLGKLRTETAQKFLWSGFFLGPSRDSKGNLAVKVRRRFGDQDRYENAGSSALSGSFFGYEIQAAVKSDVPAANSGHVIFVDTLPTLGLCVVVDHGYGLQSIYAHLSKSKVKKEDSVQKGQIIAQTGATGLAETPGALYFALQVNGTPVDAAQWWNENWLNDQFGLRIAKP